MHKINILTSMNKLPANKVNLGNFPLDGELYNPRSFKLTHRILKIHNYFQKSLPLILNYFCTT